MTEMHERLKKSRLKAGFHSASQAADAIGVQASAYTSHENGHRGFHANAERYASFYGVSLEWLISGKGDIKGKVKSIPILGSVGAGAKIYPLTDDSADYSIEEIMLAPNKSFAAYKVVGDSQYPRYQNGEYIVFERVPRRLEELVNKYCIVECEDGRILVKKLRKGATPDVWRLESHNAPIEDDVRVKQAYKVHGVLEG